MEGDRAQKRKLRSCRASCRTTMTSMGTLPTSRGLQPTQAAPGPTGTLGSFGWFFYRRQLSPHGRYWGPGKSSPLGKSGRNFRCSSSPPSILAQPSLSHRGPVSLSTSRALSKLSQPSQATEPQGKCSGPHGANTQDRQLHKPNSSPAPSAPCAREVGKCLLQPSVSPLGERLLAVWSGLGGKSGGSPAWARTTIQSGLSPRLPQASGIQHRILNLQRLHSPRVTTPPDRLRAPTSWALLSTCSACSAHQAPLGTTATEHRLVFWHVATD